MKDTALVQKSAVASLRHRRHDSLKAQNKIQDSAKLRRLVGLIAETERFRRFADGEFVARDRVNLDIF
jgi:hypothetical protein